MCTHDVYSKFLLKFENNFSFNLHHHRDLSLFPFLLGDLRETYLYDQTFEMNRGKNSRLCVSTIVDMQR